MEGSGERENARGRSGNPAGNAQGPTRANATTTVAAKPKPAWKPSSRRFGHKQRPMARAGPISRPPRPWHLKNPQVAEIAQAAGTPNWPLGLPQGVVCDQLAWGTLASCANRSARPPARFRMRYPQERTALFTTTNATTRAIATTTASTILGFGENFTVTPLPTLRATRTRPRTFRPAPPQTCPGCSPPHSRALRPKAPPLWPPVRFSRCTALGRRQHPQRGWD